MCVTASPIRSFPNVASARATDLASLGFSSNLVSQLLDKSTRHSAAHSAWRLCHLVALGIGRRHQYRSDSQLCQHQHLAGRQTQRALRCRYSVLSLVRQSIPDRHSAGFQFRNVGQLPARSVGQRRRRADWTGSGCVPAGHSGGIDVTQREFCRAGQVLRIFHSG